MPDFFTALVEHGGKGLNIIVMTQMLNRNMLGVTAGSRALLITSADLRLG